MSDHTKESLRLRRVLWDEGFQFVEFRTIPSNMAVILAARYK